jgi:hypothetical protein
VHPDKNNVKASSGIGVSIGRKPIAANASDAPDFVAWAAVRRAFGLEANQAYLESIASRDDTTATALGVPLTPAETANIEARDALTSIVGKIHDLAHTSPAFAGVSIDQAAGGVVNIALADSASDVLQATLTKTIKAIVPDGVKTEVTHLPYAEKLIDDTDANIVGDLSAGSLTSFNVLSVFEESHNLVITVAPDAPATAERDLATKYPLPFIKVERNSGVDFQTGRNHTSGPVYGGEWIANESGFQCTAGFAHALNNSGSGAYSEITAGHCGSPGLSWRQGLQYDGGHFGDATANNGASKGSGTTSSCDCQSITAVPPSAVTAKVYTSYTALFAYTSLPDNTYADFADGKRVCVSGAAWAEDYGNGGINCGTITSQNGSDVISGTAVRDGETITHLITVDMPNPNRNEQGDSGAPVGSGGQFMGIHQGINSKSEIFSRSTYISSVTGATPTF